MGKTGFIYILTNPSFPQYVKIGYATDVKQWLDELNRSTAVPFAFRVYATYEVDSALSDKKLHSILDKLTAPEQFGAPQEYLKKLKPEDNKAYPWTELGAGQLFADFYKDVLRYVPERKTLVTPKRWSSAKTLQGILGSTAYPSKTTSTTTDIYSHFLKSSDKTAAEKLEQMFE